MFVEGWKFKFKASGNLMEGRIIVLCAQGLCQDSLGCKISIMIEMRFICFNLAIELVKWALVVKYL